MTKIYFDIDLDVRNRDELLKHIEHIPASQITRGEVVKHNVGIYVQKIPYDPSTKEKLAAFTYDEAEALGYFKIDILNNSVYSLVRDEEDLDYLMNKEPNWELLLDESFCSKIAHISNYWDLVCKKEPRSIEELSMLLAIIRPAKRHLQDLSWDEIRKTVWDKTDGEYGFKKSHSLSYAMSLVVQINAVARELKL
jgi:hypothetical protein